MLDPNCGEDYVRGPDGQLHERLGLPVSFRDSTPEGERRYVRIKKAIPGHTKWDQKLEVRLQFELFGRTRDYQLSSSETAGLMRFANTELVDQLEGKEIYAVVTPKGEVAKVFYDLVINH